MFFTKKNLCRICRIFWPNRIFNNELFVLTKSISIKDEIRMKRWRWLGHVIRLGTLKSPKMALHWKPEKRRRTRRRPKKTWRKTILEDLEDLEMEWEQMEERVQDRTAWRMFLSSALCYNRSDGH